MILQKHGRDSEALKIATDQENFRPVFSDINLAGDKTANFVVTGQGKAVFIVRSLDEGHTHSCAINWAHPASKKALGTVNRNQIGA
jgi:hypothetical protein